MNQQFWWFLSRASGIVAWALLCASIVWGVLLSTRLMRPHDRPAWLLDLHKWFAALAVFGAAIHMGALVADTYVDFGWRDLSIPMASEWKPGPVTWGVLATYLLVAVQLTSLLMRKLPRRIWHLIHLTSYLMFAMTSAHAFTSGTDASNDLFQIFAAMVITLVSTLTVVRVFYAVRSHDPDARSARPPVSSTNDSRPVQRSTAP